MENVYCLSGKLIVVLAVALSAGCRSTMECCVDCGDPALAHSSAAASTAPAPPSQPIRIKAGLSTSLTDSEGNVWLPDQGFVGGTTVDRGGREIANTKSPEIYRSERYNMTSFSHPVPNGKYTVKLHFAETNDGLSAPGRRIFSFNVEGREFKDFDVCAKAGGGSRAWVETVSVNVTDGKLDVSFTPQVQNPEINGIEIIPES